MLIFGVVLGYYGLRNERRARLIAEDNPTNPGLK
jgi:hypothetical protein